MRIKLLKGIIRLILRFYHRVEVVGMEKMPDSGPCIVVGNHVSYLDPFYIGSMSPRHIHFMAKAEAFRFRFTRFFLELLQAFPVNREKADIEAIRTALSYLKQGSVVGIFPEGGIRDETPLQEVKQGAAFLACKSGTPVLPIYIDGSMEALPQGKILIRPKKIRILVGNLISVPEEGTSREKQEVLSQLILSELQSLQSELK